MPDLRATVGPDGDSFKMVWSHGDAFRAYSVPKHQVNEEAENVRKELQAIVSAYCQNNSGGDLRALAAAGYRLYDAMFADPAVGRKIQDYIERKGDEITEITFELSTEAYVPWGLIYDRDPDRDPDKVDESRFWCIKYTLASHFGVQPDDVSPAKRPQNQSIILAANKIVLNRVVSSLPDTQTDFWQWIKTHGGPIATAKRDLIGRLREHAGAAVLVYFLCHANGQLLSLGVDDVISPGDIRLALKSRRERELEQNPCLIFLNGCRTAWGSQENSFHRVTVGSGLCGFVGTETEVPDLFAMRFSLELLGELICNRLPLGEAMKRLRLPHMPLSLVYAVNGSSHFRIDLSEDVPAAKQSSLNLSNPPVISQSGRMLSEEEE